jgi:hypothetical protein
MPKSENMTFADIKRAANCDVPVLPIGGAREREVYPGIKDGPAWSGGLRNATKPVGVERERIGMVADGNPDVLAEAADRERNPGIKDGPAWREGLRNGTQVQHSPGKKDLDQLGSGRAITY